MKKRHVQLGKGGIGGAAGKMALYLPSPRAFFAFPFLLNDFSPLSRSLEQAKPPLTKLC